MTQTVRAAQTVVPRHRSGGRRSGRGHHGRLLALLALLVLLGAWAVWLALGLLDASRTVQARAAEAQASLEAFRSTLKTGDQESARRHLSEGESALAVAEEAADRPEVRVAGVLPYLGRTVSDLDHLLAAARILTDSGDDTLAVYADFAGENSQLFRNGRFDLGALERANRSVTALSRAMDRARAELEEVTGGGPRGGQAVEKRDAALAQVESLSADLATLRPLLERMPTAVGADRPHTYLVTVMNPAELRAPGGTPLSVAFVRFDEGRMTIPLKGQTSVLTNGNGRRPWEPVEGDPWGTREPERFINASLNPDFTVAGEEMVRAAPVHFGPDVDGVIALDVVAISHLLRVTGPIRSEAYGRLTADNVVRKLLVDAYANTDQVDRHEDNDDVMTLMLSKLVEGGGMIGKVRALGEAVPGRHLQLYFRDDQLQQVVRQERSAGEVAAPETGDLAAVYTQNSHGSKVDIYQHRTVRETIRLAEDGSATVRRTVVIENRTKPDGPVPSHRWGYFTRWSRPTIINLFPPGAEVVRTPDEENSEMVDGAGRPVATSLVWIEPGQTRTFTWDYRVPRVAVPDGDGLRLLVHAETQAMLNVASLEVTVVAPDGWAAQPGPGGWAATPEGAAITVPLDRARLLQLKVAPDAG